MPNMLLSLVMLTAGVASAMPAGKMLPRQYDAANTTYTLAPLSETLRINGELVGASGSGLGVGVDVMDVYDYALQYREKLENPATAQALKNGAKIPRGDGPYVGIDYTTEINSCQISDPQLISSLPRWYCNSGDKCTKAVTLSSSLTQTSNYGYKIGTSVKGSGKAGIFTAEVTISGEFSGGWSSSESKTQSITDTWTISYGQVCQPAVYQFDVDCNSKVTVSKMTLFNSNGSEAEGAPENICTFFSDATERANYLRGEKYDSAAIELVKTICDSNAKTDAQGNMKLDLNDGATVPTPVIIQGCHL